MAIDPDKARRAELAETSFSWDPNSVILYHLGLGAGVPATSPGELEYCYESSLKVLPSFGSIPPFTSMMGLGAIDGLEFNFVLFLHGEQETTVSGPIPTSGTVVNRGKVVDIFDKGKGALVILEMISETPDGEELFRNKASIFLRGEGGGSEETPVLLSRTRRPNVLPTQWSSRQPSNSRRCCTASMATRIRFTSIRRSRRWVGSSARFFTGFAHTGLCARQSSTRCWTAMWVRLAPTERDLPAASLRATLSLPRCGMRAIA